MKSGQRTRTDCPMTDPEDVQFCRPGVEIGGVVEGARDRRLRVPDRRPAGIGRARVLARPSALSPSATPYRRFLPTTAVTRAASALQPRPGAYALLLGSGTSRSAGIQTG